VIYNTAKVTPEGQITLPLDVREKMQFSGGDHLAVIYENDRIIIMNPAIYAMEKLQKEMANEWENAGIHNEDSLFELCREIRQEFEKEALSRINLRI